MSFGFSMRVLLKEYLIFQFLTKVLTKDLERHAAELQAQEGLSNDGETMVNVPHIFAR